ncbi:hypothetical protein C6P45_004603 [Maudiozyma exigua]|uniref:Ubiquitin carboxyl-terminal hydrolase n=1 Tax=Maudiozyma exigua TaxID=34358 RepID=A0A9P6WCF4_MAUEX|nr:hypothetical protein C6P45_004603 [Kazachstania exigua]
MLKRLVGSNKSTKEKKKKDEKNEHSLKKPYFKKHEHSHNSKPRTLKTSSREIEEVKKAHINIEKHPPTIDENSIDINNENIHTHRNHNRINHTDVDSNYITTSKVDTDNNIINTCEMVVTPPDSTMLPDSDEKHKRVKNIEKQLLFPKSTNLLPFGDGTNKVFGYENFGNTCYCNSVLQCLYHLDNIRDLLLEYPTKGDKIERKRKFKTIGNMPRVFTRESFEPVGANPANNSSNNSSKISDDLFYNDSDYNDIIYDQTDNEPTGKSKEKDNTHKKTSFKHALSKYSSDGVLPNNLLSDAASFASKKKDDKQTNNSKNGPIHTIIMSSDSMTEKLHDGCKTIIVGRRDKNDIIRRQMKTKSAPTSPLLNPNKKIDSTFTNKEQILTKPAYSSEQRKKAALIRGPVLHLDHMINVAAKPNLYNTLKDIFECINENESLTGVVSPTKFIKTLKRENILFNSSMQQDAHEFLNYLLNNLNEYLSTQAENVPSNIKNTVIDQFQGVLSNRSKCLTCDTMTASEEPFLDFPIEIKGNESIDIQEVLHHYHQREILNGSNKFYCNQCYGLQEAERLIGLKKLPTTLAINLKRFKYVEEQNANVKLFNKIAYPAKLSVESTYDPDYKKEYELTGVVIHLGSSPQHGHYVSLCKSKVFGWLLFDDETVESVDEPTVLRFTGDSKDQSTAYVLFYQEIHIGTDMVANTIQDDESVFKVKPSDENVPEDNISQLIKYDDLIRETKRREKIRQIQKKQQQQQQQQQQHIPSRDNSIRDDKKHGSYVNERTKKHSSSSTKSKRGSRILSFIKS